MFEDIPQLCIAAFLQSNRDSWSSVVVYSMATSSVSLLYTTAVTIAAALMVSSGKEHAVREESEKQLMVLALSDRSLIASSVSNEMASETGQAKDPPMELEQNVPRSFPATSL
jgi:hypothetical protein